MNALRKAFTGLGVIAATTFGGKAVAQDNGNVLAYNAASKAQTEVTTTTPNTLNAPVVKESDGSWDAVVASRGGNLAVHVFHGKNDPISGERYAKGFANGFASRERTEDKPIYITATHNENKTGTGTFVKVYINGQYWEYEGRREFDPVEAGKLAPVIMNDYVKAHGTSKLIPLDQQPVVVASMN